MPFLSATSIIKSFTDLVTKDVGGPYKGSTHLNSQAHSIERLCALEREFMQQQHEKQMLLSAIATGQNGTMDKAIKRQLDALASSYEQEINKRLVEEGILSPSDIEDVEVDSSELEITEEVKKRMEDKIQALQAMWGKDD